MATGLEVSCKTTTDGSIRRSALFGGDDEKALVDDACCCRKANSGTNAFILVSTVVVIRYSVLHGD
jgi:hypothetical protein